MDPITAKLMSAAGAAADSVYVDDVFSTFLYDGTGSAQTITNGIDLSGEGGLVWLKSRNNAYDHRLTDTERGLGKALESNTDYAEFTTAHCVNGSFNSDGFSLSNTGTPSAVNTSGDDICSWTFRKCPGFFDIVTYTGNGTSGRTVAHNLGSVPGCIMVKRTSDSADWAVYHRANKGFFATDPVSNLHLHLNQNHTAQGSSSYWNDTDPTSSVFTVGNSNDVNQNGETYVAYLFAHDDQSFGDDGDESIIKCGSFTASSGSPHTVTVGFEPQWVIIKRTATNIGNWTIIDNMRGWMADTSSNGTIRVLADENNAEDGVADMSGLTSTGFTVDDGAITYGSNQHYVYIAIRRPHKPPEAATDVFTAVARSGTSASITASPGNNRVTDMVITKARNAGNNHVISSRIAGQTVLGTDSDSDDNNTFWTDKIFWDKMSGVGYGTYDQVNVSGRNYIDLFFKRAAKFFDVVHFGSPSGGSQTISHSLTVPPEMIWVKNRDSSYDWQVYHQALGTTSWLYLNQSYAASTSNSPGFANVGATTFDVGNYVSVAGSRNIAYLFATLPGISKVGSYTGTGSDLNIDCGFTNGARFVLIKRTTGTTDWWYVDTARGINSGNDPALMINSSSSETSSYDLVDPYPAGFTAASGTSAINTSGETYIYLAIA